MRVRVGTSGYSYPKWRGSFYPEKLRAEEMLAFYATRLGCVEINNTFYRMPKRSVLEGWADDVRPNPEFRFVLKASQRITHMKRLHEVGSDTAYLLETASVLGESLGPLLFQLPPYLKKEAGRLRTFLSLVPPGRRVAFEFRHESWLDAEVESALRDAGAAQVLAETDGTPADTPIPVTADWGYLRLRREEYDDAALEAWAVRILAQPWSEAYVFFKHEDDASCPVPTAERLIAALAKRSAA